ncbi:cyclic AMP-dependent transcription factor ATF-7 isoform X2 [Lingula anatina]|uniref:Cyclic AMP-dependent transcription factor ATF-7 isoform X2 n=1 Tax=Lingula anatina TaxID=7574 RepID=A0A1S3I7T5_LINAN|nr:cyclic AMP-dependent transcription factor ATF-7 isoform X2 [Lingula anatina]|eukprot:XP_013394258.1 cyclic AMP-dependent transcription factor ATF-7 isoform X2 [Lingula anatina]
MLDTECSEPDSSWERFTNEDRLAVHKQKHQFALTLNTSTKEINKILFVDQTPTPTKFLKNCDEIGLFQELKGNPFDESFKKAIDYEPAVSENAPLPGPMSSVDTPVLPKMLMPLDNGLPSAATSRKIRQSKLTLPSTEDDEGTATSGADREEEEEVVRVVSDTEEVSHVTTAGGSGREVSVTSTAKITTPSTLQSVSPKTRGANKLSQQSIDVDLSMDSEYNSEEEDIDQAHSVGFPIHNVATQKSPMPSAVTSSNVPARRSSGSGPTPVAAGGTGQVSMPSVVEAMSVDQSQQQVVLGQQPLGVINSSMSAALGTQVTTMQVLLQLPGGHTIPVQIPAAIGSPTAQVPSVIPATTVTTATKPPTTPKSTVTAAATSTSSLTKQKLKQALTQNVAQANMRTMSEAVDRVTCQASPAPSVSSSLSSPGSVAQSPMFPEVHTTFISKRSRSASSDESPDEKRRKFLERNRAAAARCRNKRKTYIGELEKKAEDLMSTNVTLQAECSQLRGEVAHLKSLLLAHKDCPVTLQQGLSYKLDSDGNPVLKTEMTPASQAGNPQTQTASSSRSSIAPAISKSYISPVITSVVKPKSEKK